MLKFLELMKRFVLIESKTKNMRISGQLVEVIAILFDLIFYVSEILLDEGRQECFFFDISKNDYLQERSELHAVFISKLLESLMLGG